MSGMKQENQSDHDKNAKQLFLKEEILNKGYQSTDFSNYLESKRDDGCNIDNWRLDEQRQIVNEFKQAEQSNPNNPVNITLLNETMNFENMDSIEIKGSDDDMSFHQNTTLKNWLRPVEENFDTRQIDLSNTTIKPNVIVMKVEEKRKKLFQTRLIYTLCTEPYNWRVERRESDFKWLLMRLRKEFPDLMLPWPEKKLTAEQMQEYLNSVMTSKIVLKSRFQQYFLNYTNYKKFYERKKQEISNKSWVDDLSIKITEKLTTAFYDKFDKTNAQSKTNVPPKTNKNQNQKSSPVTNCNQSITNIVLEKPSEKDRSITTSKFDCNEKSTADFTNDKETNLYINDESLMTTQKKPQEIKEESSDGNSSSNKQSKASAKSKEIDLHLFIEDLKEMLVNNAPILKKCTEQTDDISFLMDKLCLKINSVADLFSEMSRNYQVLNKPQVPEFEEITPTVSKIWSNMKIFMYRLSNYLKFPQKIFDKSMKSSLGNFLSSEIDTSKMLKKQTRITSLQSYSVNKETTIDPNGKNVRIFGEKAIKEELKIREKRLRMLDKNQFKQYLTIHKGDQEEQMQLGINATCMMIEKNKEYQNLWGDYLESFKVD